MGTKRRFAILGNNKETNKIINMEKTVELLEKKEVYEIVFKQENGRKKTFHVSIDQNLETFVFEVSRSGIKGTLNNNRPISKNIKEQLTKEIELLRSTIKDKWKQEEE